LWLFRLILTAKTAKSTKIPVPEAFFALSALFVAIPSDLDRKDRKEHKDPSTRGFLCALCALCGCSV
jgi:hypothetical protein